MDKKKKKVLRKHSKKTKKVKDVKSPKVTTNDVPPTTPPGQSGG